MSQQVYLVITRHPLPFNAHYDTYEWQGPTTGPIEISRQLEKHIALMPWPLEYIGPADDDPFRPCSLYVRKDVGFGLLPLYYRAKRGLQRLLRPAYCRLILTAAVWGCADYDESNYRAPSWKDLRLPRRSK